MATFTNLLFSNQSDVQWLKTVRACFAYALEVACIDLSMLLSISTKGNLLFRTGCWTNPRSSRTIADGPRYNSLDSKGEYSVCHSCSYQVPRCQLTAWAVLLSLDRTNAPICIPHDHSNYSMLCFLTGVLAGFFALGYSVWDNTEDNYDRGNPSPYAFCSFIFV